MARLEGRVAVVASDASTAADEVAAALTVAGATVERSTLLAELDDVVARHGLVDVLVVLAPGITPLFGAIERAAGPLRVQRWGSVIAVDEAPGDAADLDLLAAAAATVLGSGIGVHCTRRSASLADEVVDAAADPLRLLAGRGISLQQAARTLRRST